MYQVYVWKEFLVDYTGGLAVAVARSKNEAILEVLRSVENEGFFNTSNGEIARWLVENKPEVHSTEDPKAWHVSGGG